MIRLLQLTAKQVEGEPRLYVTRRAVVSCVCARTQTLHRWRANLAYMSPAARFSS